jgi:hypothetical protein
MENNRPLIVVACVVLAIVGGSLWFLNTQNPTAASATQPVDPNKISKPAATPAPAVDSTPLAPPVLSDASPQPSVPPSPKPSPQATPVWESQIDHVLRSTADETQTAQMLINMLPSLPPEGQEEAAQHITNLVLDESYAKVLPLVKNPNLPEEVLDVFFTDLMNREDPVKLPTLLEVAKLPNHPNHEEALGDLEVFLDEDFGTDWGKWDQAVKKYLADQAKEEAEASAPAPGKQP